MWTSSELTISVICVSVPSMRPLWQRIRGVSSTDDQYKVGATSRSHTYGAHKLGTGADTKYSRQDEELGSDNFPMQIMQHKTEISGQSGRTDANWQDADDNSDKSILGAGIIRKQEVSVTYDVAK